LRDVSVNVSGTADAGAAIRVDTAQMALIVEVDRTGEPITGTVRDGESPPTRFVGYAQLVAEIERRRGPGPPRTASAPDAAIAPRAGGGENVGGAADRGTG
jgi:hypothetical protein